MPLEKSLRVCTKIQRTFENVDEEQAALLEFEVNGFAGLPYCGDLCGIENLPGFAREGAFSGIEKIR